MEYIKFEAGKFVALKGKRPSNQSDKGVLAKVRARLVRYFESPTMCVVTMAGRGVEYKPKSIQSLFMSIYKVTGSPVSRDKTLSTCKINMAHNIAFSAIKQFFVESLNAKTEINLAKLERFGEAMHSTDDHRRKNWFKRFWQDVKNSTLSGEKAADEANKILHYLNCVSRNLAPGHASVNQSIHDNRDPFLVLDATSSLHVQPAKPTAIADTFTELRPGYAPKLRDLGTGPEMQSSSIEGGWISTSGVKRSRATAFGPSAPVRRSERLAKKSSPSLSGSALPSTMPFAGAALHAHALAHSTALVIS